MVYCVVKKGGELRSFAVNDYDALRHYLKKQTHPEFVLTF